MELATFLEDFGTPEPAPENRAVVTRTESTNLLARRVVEACGSQGLRAIPTLLVALEQTAGRGRRGNAWWSPPGGGVWATRVLTVGERTAGEDEEVLRRLQAVPLAAAAGLVRGLARFLPAERCGLEWPNDLVVGGRKIGGVLVESVVSEECGRVAFVGFGVNYDLGPDRSAAGEKLEGATSLADELEVDELPPLGVFARGLVEALEKGLEGVDRGSGRLPEVAATFRELVVHRPGEPLRCRTGGAVVEGRYAGIDERGFLRLETDGGEELLSSGEIVEEVGR